METRQQKWPTCSSSHIYNACFDKCLVRHVWILCTLNMFLTLNDCRKQNIFLTSNETWRFSRPISLLRQYNIIEACMLHNAATCDPHMSCNETAEDCSHDELKSPTGRHALHHSYPKAAHNINIPLSSQFHVNTDVNNRFIWWHSVPMDCDYMYAGRATRGNYPAVLPFTFL